MTVKINGAGMLRVFNQTNNITGASALKALLLRSGHSAGTENAATIAAYTTLNECRDSSYAQATLSGVTASTVAGGTAVTGLCKISASDFTFANAGSHVADSIVGALVAINLGGSSSANIPLLYSDFNAAKSLSGTTQPVFCNPFGLFDLTTSGAVHKVYPAGLAAIINNTVTLATAGNVYARLLMTNTSCEELEAATVAGFTLDECDDTGYSRQTVTGLTWANPTGFITGTCSALTFANNGNATRAVRYVLYCLKVGASIDGDDIPLVLQKLDNDQTLNGTSLPLYQPSNGFFNLAI